MKAASVRSLKSLNMTWLVLLAVLDMVIVLLFLAPEMIEKATLTGIVAMRALGTTMLPVVVLLLTGLLSPDVKAMLVYWKVTNPLPGCEAFTKHAPADPARRHGHLEEKRWRTPDRPGRPECEVVQIVQNGSG